MSSSQDESQSAPWFQANTYSVWAFERDNNEPILVVAYEWERAGLRAIRADCAWLHQDESKPWESYPEFDQISDGVDAAVFASLIAAGRLHRIGQLPPIGRYAHPPSCIG